MTNNKFGKIDCRSLKWFKVEQHWDVGKRLYFMVNVLYILLVLMSDPLSHWRALNSLNIPVNGIKPSHFKWVILGIPNFKFLKILWFCSYLPIFIVLLFLFSLSIFPILWPTLSLFPLTTLIESNYRHSIGNQYQFLTRILIENSNRHLNTIPLFNPFPEHHCTMRELTFFWKIIKQSVAIITECH
jgi:hypothetical protein